MVRREEGDLVRLFRFYRLWHPDSPGGVVVVRRVFPPISSFARVGEDHYRVHPRDVRESRI